ncbi:MAG: toxic anion resistance protein [Micrococcales bacterium]|nr:MAG: toxic anion resistance protein [Micrococcales bacterium]
MPAGHDTPAPTPLTPPTPVTTGDLVLSPPAAVPAVETNQAAGMIPVDEATAQAIHARATAFVAVSNRMLERPASALKGSQGAKGSGHSGDTQVQVAQTLSDLRATVTELDPGRADLSGPRKILGIIPGGDKLRRYFEKYQSAQHQLDAIIKALASGQDELRKDNASIDGERQTMWALMGKLSEYATLADALDQACEEKIATLQAQGEAEQAQALTSDALFPIRQRRQDILTQLAVAVQGYLALDLVRKNNVELIKGVDRAQTTTVSALRTAVITAQALGNQQLVLDQINALNTTTNQMIESTSALLRQQGGAIHQQASQTTISVESLQKAFDNVFATMDAIDSYKAQAVTQMAHTVDALEGQVRRARPYLERSRQEQLQRGVDAPPPRPQIS